MELMVKIPKLDHFNPTYIYFNGRKIKYKNPQPYAFLYLLIKHQIAEKSTRFETVDDSYILYLPSQTFDFFKRLIDFYGWNWMVLEKEEILNTFLGLNADILSKIDIDIEPPPDYFAYYGPCIRMRSKSHPPGLDESLTDLIAFMPFLPFHSNEAKTDYTDEQLKKEFSPWVRVNIIICEFGRFKRISQERIEIFCDFLDSMTKDCITQTWEGVFFFEYLIFYLIILNKFKQENPELYRFMKLKRPDLI